MPFTLAHPAAVVPLRRALVLSALVVGSLAPDFRYFFELAPRGHFGHNLKGVFVFCLPVGLAVLWLFQKLMKLPMISLAPERHQQRLAALATPFRWGPSGRFALILFSLFVGAISHLVWDAFTHDRGFAVRNLPDLRAPALEEFGSHRPLYDVLQHGSSLLGMGLLAFWYWRWFKRTAPLPVPAYLRLDARIKGWFATSVAISAGGVSFLHAYNQSNHMASRSTFVGTGLVTFMSLVFLAAFGFSLWWQWRRHVAFSRQHSAISHETDSPQASDPAN